MAGGRLQNGGKDERERPPSFVPLASPGTPNADLSEYTPTTTSGPSNYIKDTASREYTPTTDMSEFQTPPKSRNPWSPDHRFVDLADGADSEREQMCENTHSKVKVAHPLTLFIIGALLGLFINIFAFLCVPMVDRKQRTSFAVACMFGALAQTALAFSTYKYFGPPKF